MKEPTRSSGGPSSKSSVACASTVDLAGLNRTLWEARHEAGYIDDIALSREDYRLLGRVSEPERSRILFRRAIEELAARPGRYAQLCLRACGTSSSSTKPIPSRGCSFIGCLTLA